jgi:hypothetical protein
VVKPPSSEPRREVSSFLLKVLAIIPASADSVKPARFLGLCQPLLERSINVTKRLVPSRHSPCLIIYSGPKRPYSDQSIWPITACNEDLADLEKIHSRWTFEKKLRQWGIDELKPKKK